MTREERKEAIGVLENAKHFAYDESYTKAFDLGIEALKQEPCEDAISRKATLDAIIKELCIKDERYLLPSERTLYNVIKEMPPVTPAREHGEWIETGYSLWDSHRHKIYECLCSECKGLAYFRKETLKHTLVGAKCCPCCGADMRKEQSK